jgi:hypothetical protein
MASCPTGFFGSNHSVSVTVLQYVISMISVIIINGKCLQRMQFFCDFMKKAANGPRKHKHFAC